MKTYTVVYLSFGKGFKVMLFILKFFFGFQLFSLLTNQLLGKLITTLCVMWGGGVMHYLFLKNTAICSILTEYSARVNNSEMRVLSQILEYPL